MRILSKPKTKKVTAENMNQHFFDDSSPHLDSFGLVLLMTCGLMLLLLFVDIDLKSSLLGLQHGLVSLFAATTLIYSLRASGVSKRYRMITIALIAAGFLTTFILILGHVFGSMDMGDQNVRLFSIIWVIIAIVTPIATTRRVFMHRTVTMNTLFAAVASYLQIAIAFALTYMVLDAFMDGQLFKQAYQSTLFMYFSLVTITTVGYGDLTATNDIGRAISVLEALVGQIYLVVVIAMLVGLFVVTRDQVLRKKLKSKK